MTTEVMWTVRPKPHARRLTKGPNHLPSPAGRPTKSALADHFFPASNERNEWLVAPHAPARVSPPSRASMRLLIYGFISGRRNNDRRINRCSQNREGEHYARNGCGKLALFFIEWGRQPRFQHYV